MRQKIINLFLLFFLLVPLSTINAGDSTDILAIKTLDEQLNYSLVYISRHARESIIELKNLLPNYHWSSKFKNLCLDMQDEGTVALYQYVDQVVNECLEACSNLPHDQRRPLQARLENYRQRLQAGKAHISVLSNDEAKQLSTRSKCKRICKLSVHCLTVNGGLFVNGVDFTILTSIATAIGAAGPGGAQTIADVLGVIAAAGPAGVQSITDALAGSGFGGSGYGYIYTLDQAATVAIEAPILFDSNGPLLGVTHTPGSPSINIVSAGTYAITFSVSGTEANQFAIFVNGAPDPSTIYGSGAGTQQNTGFAILTLGAGDVITIVNHSSAAAVTLAPNVGGTQDNVRASVLIERLA